jgi:two-component system LytT family response regulator
VTARIRAVIVEDEPLARDHLAALLRDERDVDVIRACATGAEARQAIDEVEPDLVFMDIHLPEVNGMEVASGLGGDGARPLVIFVTAHDEYAIRAFEIDALDYLMKPFSAWRLKATLARARDELARRRARGAEPVHRDRLVVKTGGRVYFVRVGEIDWCEADGNYVALHAGAQRHFVRRTMASLEAQLDPRRFVRIHRSAMVNIDRIQELQPTFGGEYVVVLRNGERLPLSRGYRDALQTRLQTRL